jgi:hypothetical protein
MTYYQEWYLKNKEKAKEYHKKYYQDNKADYIARDKVNRKKYSHVLWKRNYDKVWRLKQGQSYILWRSLWRRDYDKQWRIDHRDKYLMYQRLHQLIQQKVIKRLPCQICGELKTHFHHFDYNKPAEVYHLCKNCHQKAHLQPNILKNLIISDYSNEFLPQKRGRKKLI